MQGTTMERGKLQALAAEPAEDIKTEADLNALSREPVSSRQSHVGQPHVLRGN